jgi:hypothetical protein
MEAGEGHQQPLKYPMSLAKKPDRKGCLVRASWEESNTTSQSVQLKAGFLFAGEQ